MVFPSVVLLISSDHISKEAKPEGFKARNSLFSLGSKLTEQIIAVISIYSKSLTLSQIQLSLTSYPSRPRFPPPSNPLPSRFLHKTPPNPCAQPPTAAIALLSVNIATNTANYSFPLTFHSNNSHHSILHRDCNKHGQLFLPFDLPLQ